MGSVVKYLFAYRLVTRKSLDLCTNLLADLDHPDYPWKRLTVNPLIEKLSINGYKINDVMICGRSVLCS